MGNYCVCWKDGDERGVVKGEENMDGWAEAEEVCSYFRDEQDGLTYYVGYGDATPADPGFAEALWLLEYLLKAGDISPAEYKLLLYHVEGTPEEDDAEV